MVELSERSYQFVASQVLRIRKIPDFKIKNYQSKFDYQMKKLFPRRKHRPNLYTLRHMHGTKLKNSNLTRKEVAYLMGHQSTESIARYGDKRQKINKSSLQVRPGISIDKINKLVRDKSTDYRNMGKAQELSSEFNQNQDLNF